MMIRVPTDVSQMVYVGGDNIFINPSQWSHVAASMDIEIPDDSYIPDGFQYEIINEIQCSTSR
jgi:hypothetical protein